ncbi:hypothetical protein HJG54_06335 [Leptolyngbya sp. NK1-12]|uniref:DUF104 domain-containing protein n=1 Tax=Leptolyngbya sp. NK1-12 TaxID=2547451 RepID=A0AA96WCE7_9CYAN|nr:hypothetical protein [Leptolyngbya sp. NK1-12]WNZ22513.1 hypothetical protein HJG54_06335 [Leptolyngbya sp. NK1-12]
MQTALHVTTRVLPGNKIEIELPPGSEGQEVNVFVVLPEQPPAKRVNVLELIEEARRYRIGMTGEQIDAYLREERASWDF